MMVSIGSQTMCGPPVSFSVTNKEAAVLLGLGVLLSPVLLAGGILYGLGTVGVGLGTAGCSIFKGPLARREARRQWRLLLRNNDLSGTQDAVMQHPYDTTARLKLATSLFALGDLPAALRHFDKIVTMERDFSNATNASGHMPSVERRTIANYFAGMCCLQLRRFSQGAAHMEEASQFLEMPEGQSTGLDCAEALALAAYLRYLAVVYAERDVHEGEQRAGLQKACTLINKALALRKGDQTDCESAVRSHAIAACIYFRMGIAADGAKVDVDTTHLAHALDHVNAALDGVSWISASEVLVHEGAPVADGGPDTTVSQQEAALVHAHSTHFGPHDTSAADALVAEGDSSSDSDGDAKNDAHGTAQETSSAAAEVSPSLPIVAKYSVPELLTVKGQILLAFGLDERTAEGIRLLDVALAMDASVPQSRLLDDKDAVGTDKRLGLLKAWPISTLAVADESQTRLHEFAEVRFRKPTWCDRCQGFIMTPKGYRCGGCQYEVHSGCRANAETLPCYRADSQHATDANVRVNHVHHLVQRRVYTTHDCGVCNRFIWLGTQPYQCRVCNIYVHVDCTAMLPEAIKQQKEPRRFGNKPVLE
jgi:tetratricopeptide (TPR) repeat protein